MYCKMKEHQGLLCRLSVDNHGALLVILKNAYV